MYKFDLQNNPSHPQVVAGLLHSQFGVGILVPHAIIHAAEAGGLGVAVISTAAAVLGELLASRKAKEVSGQAQKEKLA